uniref:Uncharacterized 38.5 kDa protein in psbA intron 1 n=2 Tax=Chlamydomonas moewusii TaxID=3054 RepID=YCX1_CHLMO|nr:RecName: Full=Uncharacterized 38.5 kDa protein in psbA intron 1 [Chlamydomonas moewusii]ABU88306.1 I-CmoeI homing endonuclease [Chlamydomonas moewusii]CAA31842.1 unnamed protein product [Chlamydomonas moewusii]CAA33623.1 unnamed protein product [Chlamydomonas moewusii]
MSRKKTIKDYENLAATRNHEVISVSNKETPSQGDITLLCKTCNKEFTTTTISYQNARKTGCPHCKATSASLYWTGRARTKTPEQAKKNAEIKEHINKTRKEKGKAFANIKNKEDLKEKLTNDLYLPNGEKNAYNDFILKRLNDPVTGKMMEKHHIIPLHAGGPDEKWNLISLTPEDHIEAHNLRYLVYNETGDKNTIKFRNKTPNVTDQISKAKALGNETRRAQGTGIYEPGMSSKAGKIGGSVKSVEKDLKQSTKMTSGVYDALYNGSRWKHTKTNTEIVIPPNTIVKMPQLVEKLIEALPPCEEKTRLAGAKLTTATSALARVIKGKNEGGRSSYFGWSICKE